MKYLALFLIVAIFTGCAQTVLYDRHSGKPIAKFQGDMTGSHYADGGTMWDVQSVSHSSATLAGGQAFKMGADSIGTTVVSGILAGGAPWAKAAGAATAIATPTLSSAFAPVIQSAAPVILQSKH